ncbi:MAG TPA: hypothetical protein VGS19_09790 [Streptosporangiaceae bacterium]|nr:hypothetical protein [Streptosporangiaceae bacterium]
MTLAPRAVLVHRRTQWQELLDRHGTRGQAAFFLSSRGRDAEDVESRHEATQRAIATVTSAIPPDWRRGMIERADLPRFLFEPGDIVVAIGQDGLVANLAKYLSAQPVIGVNPLPAVNPGILVPHAPDAIAALLGKAVRGQATDTEELTMAEVRTDDGQSLHGLNEIYVGHPSHQTARYSLRLPDGAAEHQASSGVIISTGTGATGWARSAWLERHSTLVMPAPAEQRLAWFVREAWPSPLTRVSLTEGSLVTGAVMTIVVESDRLVAFGDGVEGDAVNLTWGQTVAVGVASQTLRLLR